MTWTPNMRRGAVMTALTTICATVLSIMYLWFRPEAEHVSTLDFIKMAAIVGAVWILIGITMGIFIVMILRKNEQIERGE